LRRFSSHDAREEPVDERARVLGARVLGDVLGVEGEQVADLAALEVGHAERATRRHVETAPLARGNDDSLSDIRHVPP